MLTERQLEDQQAIGGIRNPRHSVNKVPGHKHVGERVAQEISRWFDDYPQVEADLVNSVGKDKKEANIPSQETVASCMSYVKKVLPHTDERCENAAFIDAWAMKANDPDRVVATWLRKGAPAGILHHAQQAGIFPPTGSREEAAMERALNE